LIRAAFAERGVEKLLLGGGNFPGPADRPVATRQLLEGGENGVDQAAVHRGEREHDGLRAFGQ
jgi:hypothetical protein